MTGSKKSSGKGKAKRSAQSARPAKLGHKKVARKLHRKSSVKHASKASRSPGAMRHDDQYMKFSGKFTVRLPKSLHQALVERAEKEGVSLNLFVTNALSRTVAVPGKKR
jgi:predicted HicB family RNase H-like nuclease